MEWYSHTEAEKAGRFKIDNSNIPSRPYVSESMESDLVDNFETIRILTAALGFPVFDQIATPDKKDILICKGKEALAEGEYTEDGLVVFKESTCNLQESKTAGSWVIGMRKKLVDDGVLVNSGNVYKFTSNHIFSSPSAAAAVVLARRANGWIEWKYKNGKTLDEVKRKSINTI